VSGNFDTALWYAERDVVVAARCRTNVLATSAAPASFDGQGLRRGTRGQLEPETLHELQGRDFFREKGRRAARQRALYFGVALAGTSMRRRFAEIVRPLTEGALL